MKKPLRPPGALPERDFLARCLRCGKCAQVCPFQSIRIAGLLDGLEQMGTPFIKPREKPCWLCMKCTAACPSGALDRKVKAKEIVRMGLAKIDNKTCLAWQGTLCRSCYDECPIFNEALIMDAELRPVVNDKKCTGCGICESVCPVDQAAIVVQPGVRS